MSTPREARLHLPGSHRKNVGSVAIQELAPLAQQLAAQHGITLTSDTALLQWLAQASVPNQLDAPACAAIAVVMQQFYALSLPGGGDGGAR
ncbi:MAG: hypothetical protein Q8L45_05185 [Xanthomonadaceae bacterium]|nr:hypothetical protein [Xanthomonadaceae bacterium]MDP2185542.1 hypothetical protein [Xanthomonadales bacterium]MDZ4115231.1 hypothetical protein [Xanthomonadaceae bacterium]MDZ4377594.1 hypothetical protein [Xanthomonadaceae bacterium]